MSHIPEHIQTSNVYLKELEGCEVLHETNPNLGDSSHIVFAKKGEEYIFLRFTYNWKKDLWEGSDYYKETKAEDLLWKLVEDNLLILNK